LNFHSFDLALELLILLMNTLFSIVAISLQGLRLNNLILESFKLDSEVAALLLSLEAFLLGAKDSLL